MILAVLVTNKAHKPLYTKIYNGEADLSLTLKDLPRHLRHSESIQFLALKNHLICYCYIGDICITLVSGEDMMEPILYDLLSLLIDTLSGTAGQKLKIEAVNFQGDLGFVFSNIVDELIAANGFIKDTNVVNLKEGLKNRMK